MLKWENSPRKTKSFVIVCYDTYPKAKNWIHWIVVDVPKNIFKLKEGASATGMPDGSKELYNSFGFKGYGGPQPPKSTGIHCYSFTVYALSSGSVKVPNKILSLYAFKKVLQGKILGRADISGNLKN